MEDGGRTTSGERLAAVRDVRGQQAAARDWADAAGGRWTAAEGLWTHLSRNTNHVRALERVDWGALLPEGAEVLDLGCGSGWLSALLSRRAEVARVLACDASERLLTETLPEMVSLLDGDPAKIERICGDFVPVVLADESVDVVVMSSAFHHSEHPRSLLDELRRVLVASGVVLLLNETPWSALGMLWFDARIAVAHAAHLATGRAPPVRGHVAFDHVLYDPLLGDRAYTMRGWRSLARRAGWSLEPRPTGLTAYPRSFRPPSPFEPTLTHFLLRPR